jgi:streptogramin lyase
MLRLLLALLLSLPMFALGTVALPERVPIGLGVSSDGALWYAAQWNEVGRVRSDGAVESVVVPQPFAVEGRTPMHALPGGGMLVGSLNGQIARFDGNLNVTLIWTGDQYNVARDFAPAPDGAVWVLLDRFGDTSLGKLRANGHFSREPLPFRTFDLATAPDGTLYLLTVGGVRRETAGGFEVVAPCNGCVTDFLEVTPDGTVWFGGGYIAPDGTFHPNWYDGSAATVGPDGNVWLASRLNAVHAVHGDGSIRTFPFADTADVPQAIVSFEGAIWYAVPGEIRRLDPATTVDLRLRRGDVVAMELQRFCCFEGEYPVLAFHRRGAEPFVRRVPETDRDSIGGRDVYAVDADTVLVEEPLSLGLLELDGRGTARAGFAADPNTAGRGVVVDRDGTRFMLRKYDDGYRLLTQERALPLPIASDLRVEGIDLAADQCTLFYAATGVIGTVNVCNGTAGASFTIAGTPEDLRILPNGDLLVASRTHVTRYDPAGAVLQQFEMLAWSVALDVDPRYAWVGGWDLRRIDLATGATVEVLSTYGAVTSISVVGEPRAARTTPARRRAARR